MNSTPNPTLMLMFGTDALAREGEPSMMRKIATQRRRQHDEEVAHEPVLPWGGKIACMRESADMAWQAGAMMAKQAGLGGAVLGNARDFAAGVAKLPFQAAGAAGKAAWNTSRATKLKALPIAAGIGVGGAALGAGALGSHAIKNISDFATGPEQEHIAHVMDPDELEKQALNIGASLSGITAGAKNLFSGGAKKAVEAGGKALSSASSRASTAIKGLGQVKPPSAAAVDANIAKSVAKADRMAETPVARYMRESMEKGPAPAPAGPSRAQQYYHERQQGRNLTSRQRSQQAVERFGQRLGIQPENPTQVTPIQMDKDLRRSAAIERLQRINQGRAASAAKVAPPTTAPAPIAPAPQAAVKPPTTAPAPATGKVNAPPASPPPPAQQPKVQPPPTANAPAAPQQATQPAGQPAAQQPPTGTSGQKGQQAATQSADQGAAAVQTPQEAGKGMMGKMRGALPWIGGGLGLGVAGAGIGASMLAGRAAKEMGREGHVTNTYQGYGAPIAGSASPYGYVTGPGLG